MMSEEEINLIIRSEQNNIIRTFYKNDLASYQIIKTLFKDLE